MQLKRSPFYLLNVSCRATRREILAAAEDAAFLGDPQQCEEAGNTLLNPSKRLSAELDWFLDLSRAQEDAVRSAIGNGSAIDSSNLRGLSRLNALLHNFGTGSALETEISAINACYETVNVRDVSVLVNAARAEAKLPEVQVSAVSQAFGKKREDIRRTISDRLAALEDRDIIKIATGLARTYSNMHGEGCTVIHDIIDWYELHMQGKIEEAADRIAKQSQAIRNNVAAASRLVSDLINQIRKWGELIRPLQIKASTDGLPYQAVLSLGWDLRGLAVFIHNKGNLTREALSITIALRSSLDDHGELGNKLKEDEVQLNEILESDKTAGQIANEINALVKEAEQLKECCTDAAVNIFIDRVCKLNGMLKKANIDTDLRTSLCNMARSVAIEIYNTRNMSQAVLKMTEALLREFGDIPSLKEVLDEDHATLMQNMAPIEHEPEKHGRLFIPMIIGIVLVVFVCMRAEMPTASPKKTSPRPTRTESVQTARPAEILTATPTLKPTATPTAKPETQYSSASVFGTKAYADIFFISPQWGIYLEGSSYYNSFVCNCTTLEGDTVWLYLSYQDYVEYFDQDALNDKNGFNSNKPRILNKRVHGVVMYAEEVCHGLAKDLDTNKLLSFSYVDE